MEFGDDAQVFHLGAIWGSFFGAQMSRMKQLLAGTRVGSISQSCGLWRRNGIQGMFEVTKACNPLKAAPEKWLGVDRIRGIQNGLPELGSAPPEPGKRGFHKVVFEIGVKRDRT